MAIVSGDCAYDTSLVGLSEQIRSIVLQTHPALQFRLRVNQLMFLEAWYSLMRSKVNLTEGNKTQQAKLWGLHLGSRAEVTRNVSCLISLLLRAAADLLLNSLSELSNHLTDKGVDPWLRSFSKSCFAEGACPQDLNVPLLSDAAFTINPINQSLFI